MHSQSRNFLQSSKPMLGTRQKVARGWLCVARHGAARWLHRIERQSHQCYDGDQTACLGGINSNWGLLSGITFVALGSVIGYMVVGGLVGTVGLLAGMDPVERYAPSAGWIAGAIVGLGNAIGNWRKPAKKRWANKDDSPPDINDSSADNKVTERAGSRFKTPTLGELAKSVGVTTLFGLVGGLLTSTFLALILICVTTSPFVPNSWRPGTSAGEDRTAQNRAIHGQNRRHADEGARVGTTFTHPLLAPIFLWSTASLVITGLLAGIWSAFFAGNEDTMTFRASDSLGPP